MVTFHESPNDLDKSHYSRETGIPDYINSTPVGRSTCPHTAREEVGLSQASVDDKLLDLLRPYTSMQSVRSILAHGGQLIGPQPTQGLQPWRCWLFIYHSLTFPTDSLHFPYTGPAQSQVIQIYQRFQGSSLRTYGRHVVFRPLGHLP
jgi:hypothetical protein